MQKPKYEWGKLWSGMEQVHEILDLLHGLYIVGSTDPVTDAVALGHDPWLRDMLAKTLLDNLIYPIAISLNGKYYLMKVRRKFQRDEIAEWLEPRGFRFASTEEIQHYMGSHAYTEDIRDLDQHYEVSNWSYGRVIWENGAARPSGWDHGEVNHEEWSKDCFLAVLDRPVTDLPPNSYPESRGECKSCGGPLSPWTGTCPKRHVAKPAA